MADYDCIVVGAGPAGSAAAYTLARNGVSVVLLERGNYPGSKNLFGGSIYRRPTEEVFPAFWKSAPLERVVTTEQLWLMDVDSAIQVGFQGLRFAKPPYNSFTVSRAKFDRWLAQQAVEAGAKLLTNTLVTDLIFEEKFFGRGKAKGVILENSDRISADVVIISEGVSGILTKKAGLRSQMPPHTMTLYVREVLALDSDIIEERFHLEKGQGATIGMFGWPLCGAVGKAGIWTLENALSFVVGGYLDQLIKKNLSPYVLLERAKEHPLIKNMLKGGKRIEYQAHLIPKGGYTFLPNLYDDGLLIAGDAALMVSGRRGTDLAMLTGKYAAETVALAKAREDFSAGMLSGYQRRLNASFFMKDIKSSKNVVNYYKKHPDADLLLAKTLNDAFYQMFTMGMDTSAEKMNRLRTEIFSRQAPLKTVDDVIEGLEYWGVF